MQYQYKENSKIFNINRRDYFENNSLDENIKINYLYDCFPDMLNIIMNSFAFPLSIYYNDSLSFDFLNISLQIFNSKNFSVDQKCTLVEIIDSIVVNNFVKKKEPIFQLISQFLFLNGNANKLSKYIFKCIYDLISPGIVKLFQKNLYEIVKSTKDMKFMSQIAHKISKNLPRKNETAKELFISFLKEISPFTNNETASLIYTAHLNTCCVFPDSFPILNLDFYANAINFDFDTQSIVLKLLSIIRNGTEIFLNMQIQDLIKAGMMNQYSDSIMINSIHSLANFLYVDIENFQKLYFSNRLSIQQLVFYLNSRILESAFTIKSGAGYLLSLLMLNFPKELEQYICDDVENCDIRESISTVFDIDQPFLTIRLLYGLEAIFIFTSKYNNFQQFYLKINEFGILDTINNLRTHANQETAKTATIIYSKIYEKFKISMNSIDNIE